MLTFEGDAGTAVHSMIVGGDTVLPPPCDQAPKKGPKAILCTPAFRRIAHDRGASAASLVDVHTGTHGSTYIFGAVIEGGGECGSYAYWAIRVRAPGELYVSPPIEGCFILPAVIRWGPPVELVVQSTGATARRYVLDEEGFTFQAKDH